MDSEDPELWQARLLLRALGLDEMGLSRVDPPEPDTLWSGGGRRVGIEVTDLNPGGQGARRESGARQGLVARARELYVAAGNPPALVHVNWDYGFIPEPRLHPTLASDLVEQVRQYHPGPLRRVVLDSVPNPDLELPTGISMIAIAGLEEEPSGFFSQDYSFIPDVTAEVVQAAVDRKRTKPMNYRGQYDEIWLLLVLGGGGRGSWGVVKPSLSQLVVETPYDRVFVFSPFERGLFEIRRRPLQTPHEPT